MSTMIGQPNKGETVYELAFSTIMLFSTIGMFATIINTVSMILDEIRQKQQEYRKNKEILNQFYNSQQGQYISQELKIQLLNYLRYFSMGHKELKQTQELQKVLKNFPEQLRKNVQRSRYTTLIRKFNILTDNFTNIILDSLVEYVEELYIMPNQIVFKKGIHTEPRLYLVLKGEISLEYQINVQKQNNSVVKSRKLKTVSEGQIFGEREFFSGLEADYTARSNTFSTILSIPRNEFIAIIKDIETDYQQFRYFQDQIVLTGSCPKICKRCKICFKDWHMENKCTLLQYVPNKLNLILRESKGQINKYSQRYFRRDRIYFNYYDVFKGHRKIVTNKYDKVLKDNIKEIKMIVEQMFERVYLQDDAYHNELIQSADIMEQTSSIMTDEDDEDDYFDEEEEQRYLMQVQNEENSSDTLPSPDYLRVDSQNQKYTDQQKQSQNEIKFDKKNWKYKNQYKTIKEENSTLMSQSYRKEPTIIIDTLEDEQQNEMEGITERKSHRSTKIEQTRLKPKLQSIYIQGDNTYNQKKENSLKKKYLKIYNNYANLLNVNQKTYSQASQAQKQAFKFVTQQKTSEKNSNTNSNNLDFPDDFSNMSPNQQPIRTKRTKTGSIILNEDAASFKNIRPKKISSGNNLLHPNNFVQRKSILNNLKNNSQQSLSKLDANKGKNMMNMSKLRNINALQNVQDNNNNPILAQIQNLVKQNMERRQSLQRVSFLNALSMANSKQYTPTSMAPYEGSVGYQVNKDLEKINKHKEEKYRGFWPLEIDAMKQYKIYFTQNNCEIILEQRLRKQLKWIESSRARKNFYKTQFISKYGTIYTENFNQNIKQKQKLF